MLFRFSEEHPANRKAMGIEIMPEGAKRQRRQPQRFHVDPEGQRKCILLSKDASCP